MKRCRLTRKLPYKEGTWFAIPLQQSGYAIGRVGRYAPGGKIILAYLFGPKRGHVPKLSEINNLEPCEAIKVIRVSDLGLIDGHWPIIGDSPSWERNRWPIPTFVRRDDLGKVAWQVVYSDSDPNMVVFEQRISCETIKLESASLYGAKAVEALLSQIL